MTKSFSFYLGKILFWIVLALVAVYLLFPFYWAINSSFKTESQLQMTPATFIPRDPVTDEIDFTFQNYGAVFRNERFQTGQHGVGVFRAEAHLPDRNT